MINWHRLFGLVLIDLFTDTGYTVEVEKDLSLQQQFLDVIVIEQGDHARLADVPDGLDNLGRYNLITYKSLHEPLDGWTLDELIGHYVNYRKQVSPSSDRLLPEERFRVYAVCTRAPQKFQQEHALQNLQTGVYSIQWGTHPVRVIVLSEIPPTPNNAVWDLFSGVPRIVQYGAAHYHWHRGDHSTITNQLYATYAEEGLIMPYTYTDYYRDYTQEILADLLQAVSPEELLKNISLDDRLKGLSAEERLKGLTPEEIERYWRKLRPQPTTN